MDAEVCLCTACSKTPEDVVLLMCGHGVCKRCLQRGWRGSYQCSVCGVVSNEESLPCGSFPPAAVCSVCRVVSNEESLPCGSFPPAAVVSNEESLPCGSLPPAAVVSNEESLPCGSLPAAAKKKQQDHRSGAPGGRRPQTESHKAAAEPPEVLLCGRHGEKAKHLCLEDKQFLCDQCRGDDQQHKGHKCWSVEEEAGVELKRELQTLLADLGAKLEILRDNKDTYAQTAEHITHQARDSEESIKREFARLHQFLRDEEASRIAALREEEEQKSKTMKSKIAKLSEEMLSLSNTISEIEELTADGMPLQSMVAAVER
ncbi:E3 ubiquitin-protein ligase TRIM7-like [Engraulis encrasicolus]|uniref:E3 ubiquitin-protein ligase TRIM7-like n=1 Tax=Engraulis encrasicolus TaxID=184585 RepID=UPI002FD35AFC